MTEIKLVPPLALAAKQHPTILAARALAVDIPQTLMEEFVLLDELRAINPPATPHQVIHISTNISGLRREVGTLLNIAREKCRTAFEVTCQLNQSAGNKALLKKAANKADEEPEFYLYNKTKILSESYSIMRTSMRAAERHMSNMLKLECYRHIPTRKSYLTRLENVRKKIDNQKVMANFYFNSVAVSQWATEVLKKSILPEQIQDTDGVSFRGRHVPDTSEDMPLRLRWMSPENATKLHIMRL